MTGGWLPVGCSVAPSLCKRQGTDIVGTLPVVLPSCLRGTYPHEELEFAPRPMALLSGGLRDMARDRLSGCA